MLESSMNWKYSLFNKLNASKEVNVLLWETGKSGTRQLLADVVLCKSTVLN